MKSDQKKKQPSKGSKAAEVGTQATTAVHYRKGDVHAVGIGNLRVMLIHEDGAWYAQGLEIDYCAQGESIEDVKSRFEQGLSVTLSEHLRVHGTIEGILVPAPREIWREFWTSEATAESLSHFSFHRPLAEKLAGIQYLETRDAA